MGVGPYAHNYLIERMITMSLPRSLRKLLCAVLFLALLLPYAPAAHAADIVDSGTCGAEGDNLTWTLDSDGVLTISGEGDMRTIVMTCSQVITSPPPGVPNLNLLFSTMASLPLGTLPFLVAAA